VSNSEPELVTNRVVLKPNIRKIEISDAGFIIESYGESTIANQNVSGQQKTLLKRLL
jgi:hypothetical protein